MLSMIKFSFSCNLKYNLKTFLNKICKDQTNKKIYILVQYVSVQFSRYQSMLFLGMGRWGSGVLLSHRALLLLVGKEQY